MTTVTPSRHHTLIIRKDDVRVFLLLVSLIGLYTGLHLYAGELIAFPFVLPNLIGMAAFVYHIRERRFLPAITTVVLLVLFALAGVILAAINGYLIEAIGKYSQLMFSIFAGYGLSILIVQIERERLRKLLACIAWGILIVAFAEVYLGLFDIMTQINSVLYSWRPQGFYTATERDIALWGQIRPLVFSTEPSLVGIWGSVLMVSATILDRSASWKRYLILIFYVGALVFVVRSGTVMAILLSYLAATMLYKRDYLFKQAMLLLGALGLAFLLNFTSTLTVMGRYLQGTSFFARFTAPFQTTLEMLDRSPFFGLGLGNDELLRQITFDVWAREGMLVRAAHYVEAHGLNGMLTNNFFWIWINLGLFGGLVLLLLVFKLVRHLGHFPAAVVLMSTLGTWMTVGGFVDMRTWFFFYLFTACAACAQRKEFNATQA